MPKQKKQIKCKQVKFSLDDWTTVEKRAATVNMKTATYIQRMAVNGKINVIELNKITSVFNTLRIIGNNINQIAKKANEINSIYAGDIEDLKENYEDICHTLNLFLSTLPSTAA